MTYGNGDFSAGMGLLVGKEDLGFGKRSWRYSMLVRDGIVEKMFIENEEPGDPFSVSDADTMFEYLAPGIAKPLDVAARSSSRARALSSRSSGKIDTTIPSLARNTRSVPNGLEAPGPIAAFRSLTSAPGPYAFA